MNNLFQEVDHCLCRVQRPPARTSTLYLLFFALAFPSLAAETNSWNTERLVSFVETYCLDCHDAETKKNDIDLSPFQDEVSFAGARRLWSKSLHVVRDHEMPPRKKKTQPTPEERQAFVQGLRELFRRSDAGKPRDPGPKVVRRLNRIEYDNTIRDLCGIELRPSVAFPPDDRQHGFENIAASLSLSPLLMERYLEAAEQVVSTVLQRRDSYQPMVRNGMKQYMNKGTNVPYRIGIYTSEPVLFVFKVAAAGRYELMISARPLLKENQSAEVSLRLDSKEVGKANFPYNDGGRPEVVKVPIDLPAGRHRITLVYLNPPADQEANKPAFPVRVNINNKEKHSGYQVFHLNLTGPLDDPPPPYHRIMAADPDGSAKERATEILGRFAGRAFRRPVDQGEVSIFVGIYEAAVQRGKSFDEAVGAGLQAILVSPHFLFRVDRDPPPEIPEPQPISDTQLASRLSYFLWSSMPDPELLDLAARNSLSENLDAQVRRMLADWRSEAFIENFIPQWLEISDIDKVSRTHRNFEPRMRADMLQETLRFSEVLLQENRPITEFLDGRFTFLNQRLVRHYGLEQYYKEQGPTMPDQPLIRVALPPDGVRAGILTHGSVLAMTSAPTRTSPVKRGMWLLENVLNTPPPPPPPDAPQLEENPLGEAAKLSLRERLEQHRDHAQCAVCHDRIDPLGFALEKFSNIGQARKKYDRRDPGDQRGALINDEVTLPSGRSFAGIDGLREVLQERPDQFTRCLTEKMLTYAIGRGIEESDLPTVDAIAEVVARDGYRMQTLIHEVVRSAPFRMRRGTEEKP